MHEHPALRPDGTGIGGKESFTCEHTLVKADEPVYTNVASIEGCSKNAEKEGYTCGHGYGKTPGTSCKFKESNKVEVGVEPEEPNSRSARNSGSAARAATRRLGCRRKSARRWTT